MKSVARNACEYDRTNINVLQARQRCCFLSLFSRKKEKQKKLAAADKSAKILSSSLDKNKLASLRQYFCLNRSTTKFLNAISPRRQGESPRLKILLQNKCPLTKIASTKKNIASHQRQRHRKTRVFRGGGGGIIKKST